MVCYVWTMLVLNIMSVGLGLGKLGCPKTGNWGWSDICIQLGWALFATWALCSYYWGVE